MFLVIGILSNSRPLRKIALLLYSVHEMELCKKVGKIYFTACMPRILLRGLLRCAAHRNEHERPRTPARVSFHGYDDHLRNVAARTHRRVAEYLRYHNPPRHSHGNHLCPDFVVRMDGVFQRKTVLHTHKRICASYRSNTIIAF